MRIGAHHVGQHVRVPAVALGPGHAVPAPVPGRGDQRCHSRTAVGLDPDLHLHITIGRHELADQLVQLPDPATPSGSRFLTSTRPTSSITSMS
jgi:hypothetical protein